jgi:TolA-binding protein
LIDATLAAVPKTADFGTLREWLHYRKIRVSVAFAPDGVAAAAAGMEQEFPMSDLLDDALAEQIFAQGLVQGEVDGAQATFRKLLEKYPRGNAIDNAHTWMAIMYRCEGRTQDAQNMNRDIIRRFPNSRHAVYARKRMTEPDGCGMAN